MAIQFDPGDALVIRDTMLSHRPLTHGQRWLLVDIVSALTADRYRQLKLGSARGMTLAGARFVEVTVPGPLVLPPTKVWCDYRGHAQPGSLYREMFAGCAFCGMVLLPLKRGAIRWTRFNLHTCQAHTHRCALTWLAFGKPRNFRHGGL